MYGVIAIPNASFQSSFIFFNDYQNMNISNMEYN
jgi:hypothetical protein